MPKISSVESGLIGWIMSSLNVVARRLSADVNVGNKEWTHECLKTLATLGLDIGYGVCPWPETMKGEWLYDLIWYMEEKSDWPNRMTDVALVLESEWAENMGDIRYDFQKLVQAKSRLKMLISRNLSVEEFKELKRDIECFQRKDESEIYIFAMYVSDKVDPFRYEIYRVGAEDPGKVN